MLDNGVGDGRGPVVAGQENTLVEFSNSIIYVYDLSGMCDGLLNELVDDGQ